MGGLPLVAATRKYACRLIVSACESGGIRRFTFVGLKVMLAGMSTVRRAFRLSTLPPAPRTTTRYAPASLIWTPNRVYVVLFAPGMLLLLNCHWKANGGVPETATLNIATFPRITLVSTGCMVTTGGLPPTKPVPPVGAAPIQLVGSLP